MKIESSLNGVLEVLLSSDSHPLITAEQLIQCIDLTLLDEHASNNAMIQLMNDAQDCHVAAICVYPRHLPEFQQLTGIEKATVINFPEGNKTLHECLQEIEQATILSATEIDYVFPYAHYLSGHLEESFTTCQNIIEACKKKGLTTKIILETGAFPTLELIYDVSKTLIELGCDFLKTSTGKITQGASLPAVFTLLSAIKDSNSTCGLKVSGGVKTPKHALDYARLAELMLEKEIDKKWFRIGASSLLNELIK